jgi:hypothetical protein
VEVTPGLRAAWVVGAVLLAMGALLLVAGELRAVLPATLVLAVAGGVTAARGRRAGRRWLLLAWSVLLLPGVGFAAAFTWLGEVEADPLAVALLVPLTVGLWIGVLVVFATALAAELVRLHLRRRRFGEASPAWKNEPFPPSYS